MPHGKYGNNMSNFDLNFYKGKKVFLTGHSGFKGTWMSAVLISVGAEVVGYSRCSEKDFSLFQMADIASEMTSVKGDVRDLEHLKKAMSEAQPEIVIHMAAQPIVRESYTNPVETYSTNVMGTVNIMEAVRSCPSVRSVLNVTTDKVYLNDERNSAFVEEDPLDGFDPYSNSKSCSELVTHSYSNSFLKVQGVAVSTARAGNVIGGGDFSKDRIIPDCVRAAIKSEKIIVRNPFSTRPYQHVLEPLMAYLLITEKQYEDSKKAGCYNVGPDDAGCFETGKLVDLFCKLWGENSEWINEYDGGPHEASFLKLDNGKIKKVLGWSPRWTLEEAVQKSVDWYKTWNSGGNVRACMQKQIAEFREYEC